MFAIFQYILYNSRNTSFNLSKYTLIEGVEFVLKLPPPGGNKERSWVLGERDLTE